MRLLQFVGLRGRGDMLARNLPYGEQRRLEIGRALATKPKLLLLDEPTAGMNPHETTEMMAFIQRGARALRHHHPADRAPDARGDVDVRSGHRAGSWREDRRGTCRPRCSKTRR